MQPPSTRSPGDVGMASDGNRARRPEVARIEAQAAQSAAELAVYRARLQAAVAASEQSRRPTATAVARR